MSDIQVNSFPNWRLLTGDAKNDNDAGTSSTFLHKIQNSEITVYQSAKWSKEAYLSSLELYQKLMGCEDSYIYPFIQDALHSLHHAYRLYGPENIIGSFNGGKDAAVILELMRAAHANYYHSLEDIAVEPIRPRVIYFNNELEFPQVYDFVTCTVDRYDLDMIAFEEGISFVEGLTMLVENNYPPQMRVDSKSKPFPMGFVLGTRTSDPNAGKQSIFAPSSSYMPSFMRINPILQWTYGNVWHFLRQFKLPYCSLYDEGYTSLGNVNDTFPCPSLKKIAWVDSNDSSSSSSSSYWPAYMLKDWSQERAGRAKKEKKKKVDTNSSSDEKKIERYNDNLSQCSTVASLPKHSVSSLSNEKTNEVSRSEKSDDVSSVASDDSLSNIQIQRKVGVIIIGDEILKGLTPDTNLNIAASALRDYNVPLARASIVSDSMDMIIAEIKEMEKHVDVIITSGGVGPTHDDVTIRSVSEALQCEMKFNDEMADILQIKMNGDKNKQLTDAQIKMAMIPSCSKLRYLSGEDEWPVLQCRNIFILPGVPQFFEKKVKSVAEFLATQLERTIVFKVVLSIDENSIVPILNNVVKNHSNVTFGSYPFVDHPDVKTVVTLEGNQSSDYDKDTTGVHVRVALSDLVNGLPPGSVLRVENNNDLTFSE